ELVSHPFRETAALPKCECSRLEQCATPLAWGLHSEDPIQLDSFPHGGAHRFSESTRHSNRGSQFLEPPSALISRNSVLRRAHRETIGKSGAARKTGPARQMLSAPAAREA